MKTRIRKGLEDTDRTTGNMVWAEFIHTTSRPVDGLPDPQLHAHVFVFNTTWDDKESRWKAGQFRELKRDAPYFQAAFRVRLAGRLQELGFGVNRKRDDFEIAGIPADVLKRFSRRTALIEKVAEEKGITDPGRKAELGAETREKKGSTLGWERLRREWNSRLTNPERQALAAVHAREAIAAKPPRFEAGAVDHAIEHSYVREAVVPERKLVTEALKRGIGTVTVEGVAREVQKRPLIRSQIDGRPMATTKEMLALEKRLIDFARQGRGRCRPLGDPTRPCSRNWFNDGQKAAVRHVLGSREEARLVQQLRSIDGWPGLEGDDLEIIQDNRSFVAKECSDSRCGRSSREVPVGFVIVAGLGVNPGSESEPLAVCLNASVAFGDSPQFRFRFFGNLDLQVTEETSLA